MNDGASTQSLIALNNDFYDGMLIIKENEKYIALPPIKFKSFSIVTVDKDTVKFHSKETRFLKRSGKKKSILKEVYLGTTYSLYSKHIPDKKTTAFILPFGVGTAYGVVQYLESEEVLFLSKNEVAYQISLPFKEERYGKKYKIEKPAFKQVMGEKFSTVSEEIKSKKLKINQLDDLIQIIDYADRLEQLTE